MSRSCREWLRGVCPGVTIAAAILVVHDNATTMNTADTQVGDCIVDLVQGIALGDQVIEVELAALIPAYKGWKIAIRTA